MGASDTPGQQLETFTPASVRDWRPTSCRDSMEKRPMQAIRDKGREDCPDVTAGYRSHHHGLF